MLIVIIIRLVYRPQWYGYLSVWEKTGTFYLVEENDDEFDQVGKFEYDKKNDEYVPRVNKNGEVKTLIDNVEKGILSDGINFKENSNIIAVGEKGKLQ